MTDLIIGSLVTLISLLIGFRLGKYQRVIPEDTQKKINKIFTKVVPLEDREVGAISSLSPRELELERNPQLKAEQEVMQEVFDNG